jgi:hypothetical protein
MYMGSFKGENTFRWKLKIICKYIISKIDLSSNTLILKQIMKTSTIMVKKTRNLLW